MTDSELTAAAARAAGIELEPDSDHPDGSHWMKSGTCLPDGQCVWHPLRNDAHAFRLAVKLELRVGAGATMIHVDKFYDERRIVTQNIVAGDIYAATRRAIVRAAAALPGATA
jgi:hypothetical protein